LSDDARPLIAITLGDAAGVGPEVCLKAVADPEIGQMLRPLLVGPRAVAERALADLGLPLQLEVVDPSPLAPLPETERGEAERWRVGVEPSADKFTTSCQVGNGEIRGKTTEFGTQEGLRPVDRRPAPWVTGAGTPKRGAVAAGASP
jgi:4-hydroxy-L-threonine phosphate dehydrogenase PdxA